MKSKTKFGIIAICIVFILPVSLFSQDIFIKDILQNPEAYEGELVEVSGLVVQYIEATEKTTAHYLLKDDYGAIIRVNTAEGEPETNVKYKANGIVYIDQSRDEPFISEKSRQKIQQEATTIITQAPAEKTWIEKNLLLIIIIGSAIILILLIIILVNNRKTPKRYSAPTAAGKTPLADEQTHRSQSTPTEELKTMVIPKPSSKTMKFIPGEIEVISGQDKGKKIKIAGYPTDDGSVVTIGREKVTGPRDYAHIELKERTISRKQAEIIYRDGKLFIKNLSETNLTRINGEEIPVNSSKELVPNSILTFGEVELKYTV